MYNVRQVGSPYRFYWTWHSSSGYIAAIERRRPLVGRITRRDGDLTEWDDVVGDRGCGRTITHHALTDHKTQAQTLPVVILDPAKPPKERLAMFNFYFALLQSSGWQFHCFAILIDHDCGGSVAQITCRGWAFRAVTHENAIMVGEIDDRTVDVHYKMSHGISPSRGVELYRINIE